MQVTIINESVKTCNTCGYQADYTYDGPSKKIKIDCPNCGVYTITIKEFVKK